MLNGSPFSNDGFLPIGPLVADRPGGTYICAVRTGEGFRTRPRLVVLDSLLVRRLVAPWPHAANITVETKAKPVAKRI